MSALYFLLKNFNDLLRSGLVSYDFNSRFLANQAEMAVFLLGYEWEEYLDEGDDEVNQSDGVTEEEIASDERNQFIHHQAASNKTMATRRI